MPGANRRVKDEPVKAQLRKAIQDKDDELVLALLDQLQEDNPTRAPARSPLASGRWRLVWSQQAPNASALQKWGSSQSERLSAGACAGGDSSVALPAPCAIAVLPCLLPPWRWPTAGDSFQIIDAEAGTLINLVDLGAVRVTAEATCEAASDTRTNVYISKTSTALGVRDGARGLVFK